MLRTSPGLRKMRDLFGNLKSINRTPLKELQKYFVAHEIGFVLDIGANIGQFGIDLRRSGYRGEIISFEPDPDNFLLLKRRAKSDTKWIVYDFALGAKEGFEMLNISGNAGLSSSFLNMAPLHLSNFPESKNVSSIITLYEGEFLFSKLISEFENYGLRPVQIFPGISDSRGSMLQVDTLVARVNE